MQSAPLRLLLALTLPTGALAADCPQPLDTAGFSAHVDRAQDAIDAGDVLAHGAAWRALQADIPCLTEPIVASEWARFLVGFAVVEHALGRNWRPALGTAIAIEPSITRDYGPDALRTWTPPRQPSTTILAPGVWVDGRRERASIDPASPHIFQRQRDGGWQNRVVSAGPLPEGWEVAPPPEASPEPAPFVPPLTPPELPTTRAFGSVGDPSPPEPPRTRRGLGLRIAGWSAAGLGAAGIAGTGLYTLDSVRDPDGDDPWEADEAQLVRAGNLGAWALTVAGVGVAVVGHVQRGRSTSVQVGPGGIGVRVSR